MEVTKKTSGTLPLLSLRDVPTCKRTPKIKSPCRRYREGEAAGAERTCRRESEGRFADEKGALEPPEIGRNRKNA